MPNADKPIWPLTSYAPSKHESLLLSGLDESPEELRVKYVSAMKAGSLNEYLQYQASKITAAEQVYANARTNSAQAYEQAVKQSKLPAAGGATTAATSSAFRQGPSVFPSTSSVFGSTSKPTTSAFGSTTTFLAFGSSNTTASAFGKPAFRQPAFGQPAFGQPSFGQTSTLGGTASAFG
ncbi:hypothetical protein BDZ97DRAFT_1914356 [Flammula alnicola]|nr:hypothetical protein BDZ97DRAFT_1914356 [Flammula alnicola]